MSDTRRDILPEEVIKSATAGSLATLLVISLAIVFAANLIASAVLKRLPVNRGYALAQGKWSLMERTLADREPVDVLIVGDSSSNQGLDPHVIEAEAGLKAMNFGVVAEAQAVGPLWIADRFLEASGERAPKVILWMHVYDIWSRVDRNDRRLRGISASLPPEAWPHIARGPRVKFTPRDLWLMRSVPLYFQNVSLSNLVRRPLASWEESKRFKFDERGFTSETTPDLALVRRDVRNHQNLVRSGELGGFTTLSRKSIDAMSQLAARHDAQLWVVQSPINRTIWQDEVFRAKWYEVRDSLKAAASRYPHVRVTFDEPVLFDDVEMQNCDHVLADAAKRFTRKVMAQTNLLPATRPATNEAATAE